jgi:serine/threonine-protein kinase
MREPDLKALPANLHPKTEDLIRRCLAKNRKDRWHAIADVRVELESIMADPHGAKYRSAHGADRRPLWKRVIPIAVAALLVAAGTNIVDRIMRQAPSLNITRFSLVLPADQRFTSTARRTVAISPDGTNVVYVANDQLYLRSLNELKARSIQSGQSIASPFFSSDGNSVGFFVSEGGAAHLKRIPVTGGSAVTICRVRQVATSSWSTDDQIFIGDRDGVFRVNANGGQPEMVVTVQPGEVAYGPQLLPGGEFLLFTIASPDVNILERWDKAKIVVQSLKSGSKPKVVLEGGADAQYVPTGHLVYAHGSTLFAVPFEVKTLQVKGSAVPVVEGIQRAANTTGTAQFGFANNGSMIYVPGASDAEPTERTIALVDRAGTPRLLDVTEPGMYNHPRISPGGTQLALDVDGRTGRNIWVHDLSGKAAPRQLTFQGSSNNRPIWTRDGKRILFTSDLERESNSIFSQSADGKGPAELVVRADPGKTLQPESWSKDNGLIFALEPGSGHSSIWMFSPGASPTSKLLIDSPKGSVGNTTISPDGRWVAYWSSELGGGDIYVQPFPPDGGTKHRISTSSNTHHPLWSPDGKQLFYVIDQPGGTGQIVSVDIQTEPTFAVIGKPAPLPIQGIVFSGPRGYDITPDGKYFVVMLPKSQADPTKETPHDQINVTLNWFEELKQHVPRK